MNESNIEVNLINKDAVIFQSNCTCFHPDHVVTVCVEDEGLVGPEQEPAVRVSLFFKGEWENDYHKDIWGQLWERIKAACKILFCGQLSVENTFTFRDHYCSGTPNHLRDFRNSLEEAIKHVEEYQQSKKITEAQI